MKRIPGAGLVLIGMGMQYLLLRMGIVIGQQADFLVVVKPFKQHRNLHGQGQQEQYSCFQEQFHRLEKTQKKASAWGKDTQTEAFLQFQAFNEPGSGMLERNTE